MKNHSPFRKQTLDKILSEYFMPQKPLVERVSSQYSAIPTLMPTIKFWERHFCQLHQRIFLDKLFADPKKIYIFPVKVNN